MDFPTDSPWAVTKAMDPSTDLPTTVLDLSTDFIQTISARTMPPTKMEVHPGLDEMDRGRKPMVTIVAGVGGGIAGIQIIVILCLYSMHN